MTNRDIFKIWAPIDAKWTDWVRPVPFISINNGFEVHDYGNFKIEEIKYVSNLLLDTAIIVDMPSYEGIKEGIALAKIGFRPIPLYNGADEQKGAIATNNNNEIETGLIWGAIELKKVNIDNNASPAFLLDSNRTNRYKMDISVFDNSWDIYDQDMPTAKYFLDNGINKIIVRANSIQRDLKKILYKYQKNGIKIFYTNGYDEPKQVKVKKPFCKNI